MKILGSKPRGYLTPTLEWCFYGDTEVVGKVFKKQEIKEEEKNGDKGVIKP